MSEQQHEQPADQADEQSPEGTPDDLPAWARDAIAKANKEAAGYRAKVRELEPLAKKARDLEDANKTEVEKAAERLTAAEQRAQEAELRALRLEVAADKGLTPAQARRLVGTSKEELEADADELLDTFGARSDDGERPPTPRRPVEKLRPGAAPAGEPEETDPRKLALAARARGPF